MNFKNFLRFIIAIAVSELAGIIGSFFTISAIPNWYSTLVKPALNPPRISTILFGLLIKKG